MHRAPASPLLRGALPALALALALSAGAALAACSPSPSESAIDQRAELIAALEHTDDPGPAPSLLRNGMSGAASYQFNAKDILDIPDDSVADTFSLAGGRLAPSLGPLAREEIIETIEAIEQQGPCSVVFLDLQSGSGISHHAADEVYLASSSKAVLAYYALLKAEETGQEIPEYERTSIEASIRSSSNEAFEDYGTRYLGEEYRQWLAEREVAYDSAQYGPYLKTSARSLARVWGEMHAYLEGGSDQATWLAGLLGDTNISFIRNGVAETGATIRNKGGWIDSGDLDSTSDAGLIELGGRTYLMVILTGQPNSGAAQERVSHLAKLLFDQRDSLHG